MYVRQRKRVARLAWRVGLSLLLASAAGKPPLSGVVANAVADDERPRPECGENAGRSGEVVPELLALADWPLDSNGPPGKDCMSAPGVVAQDDSALPAPVEIRARPVVRVLAAGMEAPDDDDGKNPFAGKLAALDAESLDGIRGGFEPPDTNLKFSFGIERAVYINGQLVATTILNVKDLQTLAGAGGVPVAVQGGADGAFAVIQNGAGNAFSAVVGPDQAGTVVQNTLNGQHIQTVTVINAAVNSAQVLRTLQMQSAVQDGVVSSLRR